MSDRPQRRIVDGRVLSASADWWKKNYPNVPLHCIHNVSLEKSCRSCVAEASDQA